MYVCICDINNTTNTTMESKSHLLECFTIDRSMTCYPVTVNYIEFIITWNETSSGVTVEAPCTGTNLNGKIYHEPR